ncbi:MAG: hypothetical protein JST92_00710 [Deltaproteobacteria bacterium]|nr:hypothetical protein [Deltaproteobacteria bacterium]
MTGAAALAILRRLGVPTVTTSEAAAVLRASVPAASHTLRRLAAVGLVTPVRRGVWSLSEAPDPMTLLESVSAPYPSYVSLQSALHLHGLIEQIPQRIYAITLGRTARVTTPLASYSFHHVVPAMFAGFETHASGVPVATMEKALIDLFYLSSTRVRLFGKLPEVELPRAFSFTRARAWVARIPNVRLRQIAATRLAKLRDSR